MSNPGTRINSIHDNVNYNAVVGGPYPEYPSWLWAEYDWWGNNPPNTSKFYVASGNTAYFLYPLSSDPWGTAPLPSIRQNSGGHIAGNNNISENVISSNKNSGNLATPSLNSVDESSMSVINHSSADQLDSLLIGITLRQQKKYSEAKDFFMSYLKKHPENQAAYVLLYHCADKNTASDIIDYFNSLPKQASKDHQLLLAYLYLKQNNVDKAKRVNNKIISENLNTSLSVRAKLNNFYIVLYNENDLNTAASLLSEVKSQNDLSTQVEINTAEESYYVHSNVLSASFDFILSKPQTKKAEEKPAAYMLSQNYPNPFNPTTIIHYEIPNDGFVTLKIYDILGREATTLISQFKTQRSYYINFDGSKLASGMYVYRLKSGNFIATKKLLLLK